MKRIYAYTLPSFKDKPWTGKRKGGRGWLKVGETERDVNARISEQLGSASPEKNYALLLDAIAVNRFGRLFGDRDVHAALESAGVQRLDGEWFEATPLEVRRVVAAVRDGFANDPDVLERDRTDQSELLIEKAAAEKPRSSKAILPAQQSGVPNATARAIAANETFQSEHTRRTYASALSRYAEWRELSQLAHSDETLALYIGALIEAERSSSLATIIVAALKSRGDVVGDLAQNALAGFRRLDAGRPRVVSKVLTLEEVNAMLAVASRPQCHGKRPETPENAAKRGRVDAALVGVLFQGGLRRGEAAALKWRDVEHVKDGCMIVVRKSNGEDQVRLVKGDVAKALAVLREATGGAPDMPVFGVGEQSMNRKVQRLAKSAGIVGNITTHSLRMGLASELVIRGASTGEVMKAGGWKSSTMIPRYTSSSEVKGGAVAKYF